MQKTLRHAQLDMNKQDLAKPVLIARYHLVLTVTDVDARIGCHVPIEFTPSWLAPYQILSCSSKSENARKVRILFKRHIKQVLIIFWKL